MATETCENQFDAMSQKLTTQELRITQRALEEMKKEYEQLKVREQSLMETARWERGRSKAHEELATSLQQEVDKLQDEKATLTRQNEKLSKEMITLRNQANDGKTRNQMEHEIIDYRTKIAGLESKLSRRQLEFEKSEESLRNEIERLQSMISATQDRLMNESYGKESCKENHNSSNVDELNQLHYKMGSLTARNDTLKEEITRHLTEKADLEHELNCLKEDLDAAKRMVQNLQDLLAETEGSSDAASRMHSEELNRVKNQKAEIRCELLRLKKEHQKLLQDIEDGILGPDVSKYESEIAELKKELNDRQIKLEEVERSLAETESTKKGEIEQLKRDLMYSTEQIANMKHVMTIMDQEAENFLKKIQKEVKNKIVAREQVEDLKKQLSELQLQLNDKHTNEAELTALKSENDKLHDKIAYLENEIKETHTDHREELAKLAKQLTANRTNTISFEMRQKEELSKKVAELEATMRQNESVIRSLNRQVEQNKAELHSAEKALSDMREKQKSIVAENTDLRKALNDAIGKIRISNEKVESLTATNNEQKEEMERLQESQSRLYDEVSELKEEIQQKDDNIAYLQSIVQPKKLEKLKYTNSQSTLVTGPDDEAEIELLQKRRSELAREVAEKAKALQQKKDQIVPLMKAESICSGSSLERSVSPSNSKGRIGTMRHDIPHRWSKMFVMVMTPTCESCYESISKFSHHLRCKSCGLIVHQHCQSSVLNTCGLPAACANFYVDHHTVPDDKMSGWVKIWKTNDTPGTKWCNAYASLEGNILSFYETDVALAQNDAPVLTVDLSQERWKIYTQTGKPIKGIETKNADCLIEIKLKNMSLFMLTRTPEAKKSWIQALQSATDRRILERNNSNRRVISMSVILRLERPLLKFQCTEIYDDWLLFGTPQGLFVTSYSQPRMPFQVAGLTNVFQLKLIRDYNLLFAIDGVDRNVVVMHTRQLDVAFNSGHAPNIQPTTYSNLAAAHLIEVSESHHCTERYLYVATADGITIFHYIQKKDMFVPTTDIKLEVPAMCILSCPGGFVFGSDSYFYVKTGDWNPHSFDATWPPDLPVGVVKISDDEILVVNHNSGVFTTPQGRRTRQGLIDWVRIPVSVTYMEPYLFIVYTSTISVVRILSPAEAKEKGALVEELEGYRAPTARVTGNGKTHGDVLVTVMNDSCVELNCFSMKNHLKRKTTSSVSHLQQPNKRRY